MGGRHASASGCPRKESKHASTVQIAHTRERIRRRVRRRRDVRQRPRCTARRRPIAPYRASQLSTRDKSRPSTAPELADIRISRSTSVVVQPHLRSDAGSRSENPASPFSREHGRKLARWSMVRQHAARFRHGPLTNRIGTYARTHKYAVLLDTFRSVTHPLFPAPSLLAGLG